MRLLSLELKNWRRHKQFRHEFRSGSTCILGPNGAGKSSLLDAVKYLLTDNWGDSCDKAGNIRIGSQGEAFAEGVWTHANTEFTVRRNLRGKSWLQIGANAAGRLTSAAEIEDRLQRLLGVSAEALLGMSFVNQNLIASFVDDTKAQWQDSVARLCSVDSVERLHKLLGERLSSDRSLASTFVDRSADCEATIADLQVRIKAAENRLQAVRGDTLDARTLKSHQDDLALHQALDAALKQRAECAKALARWEKLFGVKVQRREAKLQVLRTRAAALEKFQATWADKYPRWQSIAHRAEAAETAKRELDSLTRRIDDLQIDIADKKAELQKNEQLQTQQSDEHAAIKQRIDTLRGQVNHWTEELQLFAGGICPTCQQPITNLNLTEKEAKLAAAEAQVAELSGKLTAQKLLWQGTLATGRKLRQSLEQLERQLAGQQAALQLAQATVAAGPKAEVTAKAARNMVSAETSLNKSKVLRSATDKMSGKLDALLRQRQGWQTKDAEAREFLNNSQRPVHLVAELEDAIRRHTVADAVCRELSTHLAQLQKDLKATQAALLDNQELKARCEAGGAWVGALERWRQVTHRDALQKVIVRGYLEECVVNINKRLQEFSAPFRTALGEDLLLLAKKSNGIVHSIKQLSGGQRVVLAVAYRLAVNTQDLLVLDEPTANLDRANLDMFRDFLRDLSRTLAREGKQLLMVTHEETLVSSTGGRHGVFDDVVRLT